MFVSNESLQLKAKNYAVGAFNTNNLETTKSILGAANNKRSSAIFAVTPSVFAYAGPKNISSLVLNASKEADFDVSLHLDHGLTIEDIVIAIRNGFSSVMIDGSKQPFEENIKLTKQVVRIAHSIGVSVEAELGRLVGVEDKVSVNQREASMTNPSEAKIFVEETGVDSLAVAIGNAHGWYKGKPQLDFDRLEQIKKVVDIPLVLHGASGIPADDIKRAISIGITKINIDTEIRDAFKRGVSEFIKENPSVFDPRKILKPAIEKMQEIVEIKIDLFGSGGKT